MDKRVIVGVLLVLIFCFTVTVYAQDAELPELLEQYQALRAPVFSQADLLRVANVETKEQKVERPPLNTARIVGEILAGGVGGCVGGIGLGAALGSAETTPTTGNIVEVTNWSALIGGLVGYILGSTIGVYLVGNIGNETGSFDATLKGGCLGGCLMIIPAPIGATIGFNRTRRYKSPPAETETALINFRDGQMSLAVPRVYLRPDPPGRSGLSQSIDLLRVRF